MLSLILFGSLLLLCLFGTGVSLYMIIDSLKNRSVSVAIGISLGALVLIGLDVFLIWLLLTQTHICPNCDKINFGNNYCVECGESFYSDSICSKCHTTNSKDNNYCYYCGERLDKNKN